MRRKPSATAQPEHGSPLARAHLGADEAPLKVGVDGARGLRTGSQGARRARSRGATRTGPARPDPEDAQNAIRASTRALHKRARARRSPPPDLRRLGVAADLPALDLVGPRGEEVDQVDGLEAGGDDLGQRAGGPLLAERSRGCGAVGLRGGLTTPRGAAKGAENRGQQRDPMTGKSPQKIKLSQKEGAVIGGAPEKGASRAPLRTSSAPRRRPPAPPTRSQTRR